MRPRGKHTSHFSTVPGYTRFSPLNNDEVPVGLEQVGDMVWDEKPEYLADQRILILWPYT